MAGTPVLILLVFATCLSLAWANDCYPSYETRPDCTNDKIEGWVYWQNMHYKYFPKKLSFEEADTFCEPWDEEICRGEDRPRTFNYRAYLASYVLDWENEEIKKAANEACIKSDDVFWIGVKRISSGKLYYTDNTDSRRHSFNRGMPTSLSRGDCVVMDFNGVMSTRPCSEEHAFVCKIQPNKH